MAFIGTKQPRDLLADVNAVQAPLWEAAAPAHGERSAAGGADPAAAARKLPRCHRGFLARARAIPIVHLYDEARRRRRRLVLCGHSLGGAVAAVSAVRLLLALRALPGERGGTAADDALPVLRVVSFAQPPVGDAALRHLVRSAGWEGVFRTVVRLSVIVSI